jgi:hypothetical protein
MSGRQRGLSSGLDLRIRDDTTWFTNQTLTAWALGSEDSTLAP